MNGVHNLIELTYRTIKIEEGAPGYAAVNSDTNIMYISYPFSNFILVVNITKGSHQKNNRGP